MHVQRGIADGGEGLGDPSYPSSDPQPCSRGEVQGRKARVPLKLGPRKARRKKGRREGGPERILDLPPSGRSRVQQLYLKIEVNKSSAQVDGAQQLRKINHTRLRVTRSPRGPHQQAGCAPITYPQLPPPGVFLGHSRARSPAPSCGLPF